MRKWHDIEEANEFRCRVVSGQIGKIYQRHPTCCLPHLSDASHRSQVVARVQAFFAEKVAGLLDEAAYTMDVYLSATRVFLFGLRKVRSGDYEIEQLDRPEELLTVVEEDSQAVRKIWEQDLPIEFLEKAHLPGGMAEFISSLQQSTAGSG